MNLNLVRFAEIRILLLLPAQMIAVTMKCVTDVHCFSMQYAVMVKMVVAVVIQAIIAEKKKQLKLGKGELRNEG